MKWKKYTKGNKNKDKFEKYKVKRNRRKSKKWNTQK